MKFTRLPIIRHFYRVLYRVGFVRNALECVKLFHIYKRFRPEQIKLESGNVLYVNPLEPRGRNVLLCQARGQHNLKHTWNQIIDDFHPSVIVDIGANYGEFLFQRAYDANCHLIIIEANPSLHAWLELSKAVHPNKHQIRLHCALASEEDTDEASFHVDLSSSGRSSAVNRFDVNDKNVSTIIVPAVKLDTILKNVEIENNTLIFKIDVEGYEPSVIQGMQRTLNDCMNAIGIIEFNEELIRKSMVDPAEFIFQLGGFFSIYILHGNGDCIMLKECTLEQLRKQAMQENVEADLLLKKLR